MFQQFLDYCKEKPALYAPSTAPFWDDEHISKGMLEAHLNGDIESASRKYTDIIQSVAWITKTFYSKGNNRLLDLGCGAGLYAELFCKAGFIVSGIDISRRSIEHATKTAHDNNLPIEYICKDYLSIDYEDAFDLITLIYCDFGVLSPTNRSILLHTIKKSMKPNGILILDGFTQHEFVTFSECRTIQYFDQGYWSTKPHLCIQNTYMYPDSANYLEQYVLVTKDTCECYNIWNQAFTAESLQQELHDAGFTHSAIYDDVTGKPFTGTSKTLCVVAK